MEDIKTEAARIAAEAAQLAEQLAAQDTGGTPAPATDYSSSVSSVSVDPDTGAITTILVLYPGDTPIEPAPADKAQTEPPNTAEAQEAAASGQVPAE